MWGAGPRVQGSGLNRDGRRVVRVLAGDRGRRHHRVDHVKREDVVLAGHGLEARVDGQHAGHLVARHPLGDPRLARRAVGVLQWGVSVERSGLEGWRFRGQDYVEGSGLGFGVWSQGSGFRL